MAKFSFKNKNLYQETLMYLAIGNKGVQLALKESQRKGIPTIWNHGQSFLPHARWHYHNKISFQKKKKIVQPDS